MSEKLNSRRNRTSIGIHMFFIFFSVLCVLPLLMVVSASLSSEIDLANYGFSLLPRKVSFEAYDYLFKYPKVVVDAYKVTIFITIVGTFFSVFFMSMTAYCLSRSNFKFKGILTFFIFFPYLFSGGLVPSYIINTKYLKLADNLLVLIVPGLISVFYIIMIRTFFKQISESLFEAAKIDGASEYRIFFQIALPLSKPVLATVAFLGALGRWNEWYSAMLYIRNDELIPIQYLLQRMMMNIQAVLDAMDKAPTIGVSWQDIPSENLRMAMLVVAIGPMLMFFPFFQKYFTKGLTVGSIKG
jgi:putative aldouronate transport system permease protein